MRGLRPSFMIISSSKDEFNSEGGNSLEEPDAADTP